MSYDRESIIRKLKAMAAKAESAEKLGSEAEAAAFTSAIQMMAAKYRVDLADLKPDEQEGLDPIVEVYPEYAKHGVKLRSREVPWLRLMAYPVAKGHYCGLLLIQRTSRVIFVGRRSQAIVAAEVYLKLAALAESIADKEYVDYFIACKRRGDVKEARGFRQSFLLGFAMRVRERYERYISDMQKYFANDPQALMALTSNEVDDWLSKKGIRKAAPAKRARPENYHGFTTGVRMGDGVEFNSNRKLS